jgi:hypothetical protein
VAQEVKEGPSQKAGVKIQQIIQNRPIKTT